MDQTILTLQNGSDIRGTAIALPQEDMTLTPERTLRICAAFVDWLTENTEPGKTPVVAVGHDSRLSSPKLAEAAAAGPLHKNAHVIKCGLASTPAMFMTTVTPGFLSDAAIMITASHLPFQKNGLKFFTAKGGLEAKDIAWILQRAQQAPPFDPFPAGTAESRDFLPVYAASLVSCVRKGTGEEKPLSGSRIIVDAGNGSGGFFVDQVLIPLGADPTGSCCLDPDGTFPNHMPNPENQDAMNHIKSAVLENQADFGIIFDTDVDRAGAVDCNGQEINRNRLIALISSICLEDAPGSTIVTDSVTSTGLHHFIEDVLHGKHHRFKRGYRNVINEAVRLNKEGIDCPLAIETSGHAALRENYFLDDGAYLIAKILIKFAKLKKSGMTISSLLSQLAGPAEEKEFRLKITTDNFKDYGLRFLEELTAYAENQPGFSLEKENYEGVKINFSDNNRNGWLLARLSLHDPIIPVNIESDVPGGVRHIAEDFNRFIKKFPFLDASALCAFCK